MHPTFVNSSSSSLQTGVEDLGNDVSRSHWVLQLTSLLISLEFLGTFYEIIVNQIRIHY